MSTMYDDSKRAIVDGRTLQDGIVAVTKTISRNGKLRVTFAGGDSTAATTGDITILPQLGDKSFTKRQADTLRGFSRHEAEHNLFHPMPWMMAERERMAAEGKRFTLSLTNAASDMHLERAGNAFFSGNKRYLDVTCHHVNGRYLEGVKDDPGATQDRLRILPVAITWAGRKAMGYPSPTNEQCLDTLPPDIRREAEELAALALTFPTGVTGLGTFDKEVCHEGARELYRRFEEIAKEIVNDEAKRRNKPDKPADEGECEAHGEVDEENAQPTEPKPQAQPDEGEGDRDQDQGGQDDDGQPGECGQDDGADEEGEEEGDDGGQGQDGDEEGEAEDDGQGGGDAGGEEDAGDDGGDNGEAGDDSDADNGDDDGERDGDADDGAGVGHDGSDRGADGGDEEAGEGDGDRDGGEGDDNDDMSTGFGAGHGGQEQEIDEASLLGDDEIVDPDLKTAVREIAAESVPEGGHGGINSGYRPYSWDGDMLYGRDDRHGTERHPRLDFELGDQAWRALSATVTGKVSVMRRKLERAIMAKRTAHLETGKTEGFIDASRRAVQIVTGQEEYRKQWVEADDVDTAVSILVDGSGSMGTHCSIYLMDHIRTYSVGAIGDHAKHLVAMQACVALSMSLAGADVPFELALFNWTEDWEGRAEHIQDACDAEIRRGAGDNPGYIMSDHYDRVGPVRLYFGKRFDDRFDERTKRAIGGMDHCFGGANADGDSLLYMAERLLRREERRKVMIVLSDGDPRYTCGAGPGRVGQDQRTRDVAAWVKGQGIDVLGVGIKTNAPSRFYDNTVVVNDIDDLPHQVLDRLGQMVVGEHFRADNGELLMRANKLGRDAARRR